MVSLLAEGATFDPATALTLIQTVMTTILNIIKAEPILSGAFVGAVLLPVGFYIINRVKATV